jgi:polycystin 1L2
MARKRRQIQVTSTQRLEDHEINRARRQRLLEIRMWTILREIGTTTCFLALLFVISYTRIPHHAYQQVHHMRHSFLNHRQIDRDLTQVSRHEHSKENRLMILLQMTIVHDYWIWLNDTFVDRIRASNWYNDDRPRHLSGFMQDRSSRLIGWPTMRQVRVRSEPCSAKIPQSVCHDDYHALFNAETRSFDVEWANATDLSPRSNRTPIERAFVYRSDDELDSHVTTGEHGWYSGSGYVYEFRGRLKDIRSNLSALHRSQWIDQRTRAILIQMNLYNPNVQLFTSVMILVEFLSTGAFHPSIRIEPIQFHGPSFIFCTSCRHMSRSRHQLARSTDLLCCLHAVDRPFHDRRDSIVDQDETAILVSTLVVCTSWLDCMCMDLSGDVCVAIP